MLPAPTPTPAAANHDAGADDRIDRALGQFLLQREEQPALSATVFAASLASADRSAFLGEANAMLGIDAALGAAALPRIAGYRLFGLLGEGGTARVFAAEHEASGRHVALKVLHQHLAQNPRSRARLRREARIAQSLTHPRIVPVIECGEADGQMFLAMELLRGISLHRLLGAATMPAAPEHARAVAYLADHRALSLAFAAIADALHAAHQQGVSHRDLKPSNLMVHADGTLTVLDFGLCSSPDARVTRSGDFLGTPVYMSPEQAAGQHDCVGPASDVYSLGAVLYECVTGKPTVAPGSLPRVLDAVRGGRVIEAHRRAVVAPALSRILARCLQKRPGRRYRSARELADDLRAFAAGKQPKATRILCRRRLLQAALAGIALYGAAVGLGKSHDDRVASAAPTVLPADVTRDLAELARRDEAQFARELRRMLQRDQRPGRSAN